MSMMPATPAVRRHGRTARANSGMPAVHATQRGRRRAIRVVAPAARSRLTTNASIHSSNIPMAVLLASLGYMDWDFRNHGNLRQRLHQPGLARRLGGGDIRVQASDC